MWACLLPLVKIFTQSISQQASSSGNAALFISSRTPMRTPPPLCCDLCGRMCTSQEKNSEFCIVGSSHVSVPIIMSGFVLSRRLMISAFLPSTERS